MEDPALRDQLAALVRRMVDHPDQVEVEHDAIDGFILRVAEEDLGQVIGRQGRTARALRTLLESRSAADGVRHELKILED